MNSHNKAVWVLPIFAALVLASLTVFPESRPTVTPFGPADVVALEGRFAAESRAQGAKAAFLAFLHEESIVLQPGPVWGRAAWAANEDLPGTLDWRPDHAQASLGGEMGVATGPWSLLPKDQDRQAAEGRYVTVWRRQGGGWRVIFDGGFARPASGRTLEQVASLLDPWTCEAGPITLPSDLLQLDASLSATADGDFLSRVKHREFSKTRLFHAPSVEGAFDEASRLAAWQQLPAGTQYWPLGGEAATSGDLGYSYGLSAPAMDAPADAAYVHVWCRHEGQWRLALELRTPLPLR